MKNTLRNSLAVLIAACLLILVSGSARADEQVDEIFTHLRQFNGSVKDYQADINIKLNARVAFIPYNPTLSGKYYFKNPGKHKLVLEDAPSYLKKYPNMFGYNLPNLEKYASGRVVETTTLDGQEVWHIVLNRKPGLGDITTLEMWVNCKDYTIPRQVTNYKNDGKITVNAKYAEKEGYKVFDSMNAEFSFPKVAVSAKASASYANYKFNQNLSDEFFEVKK